MTLEADQAVQEARLAGACQDQHAAASLGWPGKRKSIVQQAETSVVLGPGAWGRGLQGLGARAPRSLSHKNCIFRRSEKSPGGRHAKGWETVETAAAEVGAWREAGTGYPPTPPPACKGEKKRVFTLSNTPPKVGGLNPKPQTLNPKTQTLNPKP